MAFAVDVIVSLCIFSASWMIFFYCLLIFKNFRLLCYFCNCVCETCCDVTEILCMYSKTIRYTTASPVIIDNPIAGHILGTCITEVIIMVEDPIMTA